MRNRFWLAAGSLAFAGALGTSVAYAVLVASSGGSTLLVQNRSENVASTTSSVVFVDVPGGIVGVTVPANVTRLVTARFTGESQCTGPAGNWCSVRVIVTDGAGVSQELNPVAGLDFAFDSVATDLWESNAIERSLRLKPGSYRVRLQRAVTNAAVIFRLDDWHFRVELNV